MTTTLYGIKYCDTMKKAFAWRAIKRPIVESGDTLTVGFDPDNHAQAFDKKR